MSAIPKRVRAAVLRRDRDCCLRCGVHLSVRGYSLHHRKGRTGQAPHTLSNLVLLCGSGTTGCHAHVHSNPDESYRDGWMVRRLGTTTPAEVPLFLRGRLVLLTDTGRVLAWPTDLSGADREDH